MNCTIITIIIINHRLNHLHLNHLHRPKWAIILINRVIHPKAHRVVQDSQANQVLQDHLALGERVDMNGIQEVVVKMENQERLELRVNQEHQVVQDSVEKADTFGKVVVVDKMVNQVLLGHQVNQVHQVAPDSEGREDMFGKQVVEVNLVNREHPELLVHRVVRENLEQMEEEEVITEVDKSFTMAKEVMEVKVGMVVKEDLQGKEDMAGKVEPQVKAVMEGILDKEDMEGMGDKGVLQDMEVTGDKEVKEDMQAKGDMAVK